MLTTTAVIALLKLVKMTAYTRQLVKICPIVTHVHKAKNSKLIIGCLFQYKNNGKMNINLNKYLNMFEP